MVIERAKLTGSQMRSTIPWGWSSRRASRRVTQQEAKGGLFHNVVMQLEVHIADAHVEVLCTTERPVGTAVCNFHLQAVFRVDRHLQLGNEISMDGHNLWAIVKHSRFNACIVDADINLSRREVVFRGAWGRDAKDRDWRRGVRTLLESCGLDAVSAQLLREVLADWGAGSENVSWGSLRQLTLESQLRSSSVSFWSSAPDR
jgi:hypothetical protein